ncbi:MAG: ATP-binding protein [candidate division WOR-3 bacterium]
MDKKELKEYNITKLLESLPTGLILIDKDKIVIEANPEARKLLGRDIESENIKDVFENIDIGLLKKLFKGRNIERSVVEVGDKTIGFSAAPIFDEKGEIIGASIILRDITEIKKMEEELRIKDRLSALGEMAAGLVHEIRNPLASIKGGIESLLTFLEKDREKYKATQKTVEIILQEIKRLERIVNDMSLYASYKKLVKSKVNLKGLVGETLLMFSEEIAERNIHIKRNFKGNLFCWVDRDKIVTVLNNLVLNAIEAIGSDGRIEINMEREKSNIIIEIQDDGGGIPPEIMPKIFDPFFTTKSKGIGLGLSIVNQIIQNHHGTITAFNKEKGACFRITLPVESEE